MASNNTQKDDTLALFPSNSTNEITATNNRAFVDTIFDDSEVIIKKIKLASDLASSNTNIYEGSLVVIYEDPDPLINGLYLSKINQPLQIASLLKIAGNG